MNTLIFDLSLLSSSPYCVRIPNMEELLQPKGKIFIRTATPAYLVEMLHSEAESWPDEKQRATVEQLFERVLTYPEAFYMAIQDGVIWGMINLVRKDFPWESRQYPNFKEASRVDNYDPWGDTMSGISLGVRPDAPEGIGLALTHAAAATMVIEGIEYSFAGSRIAGYKNFRDKMTPEEYITLRDGKGKLIEGMLRLLEGLGFEIVGLKKDYFYDPDSSHYGAVTRFKNPRPCWRIDEATLILEVPDINNEGMLLQFGMQWDDLLNIFTRTVFRFADKVSKITLEINDPSLPAAWREKFEKIIRLVKTG